MGPVRDLHLGIFGLATLDITTEIMCQQESCEFIIEKLPLLSGAAILAALIILFLILTVSTVSLSVCICIMKRKRGGKSSTELSRENEGHTIQNASTNDITFTVSLLKLILTCFFGSIS